MPTPAEPPGGEQRQGSKHDEQPLAPRTLAEHYVDHRAGREGHSEAREGERDSEQDGGEQVAATVPAVELKKHPDSRGCGAEVADLKRPEQIFVGGSEEG